jgi:septum formation protein
MQLILASTSRYRRELLARLQQAFDCVSPEIDEAVRQGETPAQRASRLAAAKADAVARRFPDALVIGSDQVCAAGDEILDKPGSTAEQIRQLTLLSGRSAEFYTAVALQARHAGFTHAHLDITRCEFRVLDAPTIADYVAREPALDCAGGFKLEGFGVSLVARVVSDDPSAVIGLPLIAVQTALATYRRRHLDARARP